jgi:hypothetical protein
MLLPLYRVIGELIQNQLVPPFRLLCTSLLSYDLLLASLTLELPLYNSRALGA